MDTALLIFPHQLFDPHPGIELSPHRIVLVEDSLFFGDRRYPARFHKQKLWLHRASMKRFQTTLAEQGFHTDYVDYDDNYSLADVLKPYAGQQLVVTDPTDFILSRRIRSECDKSNISLTILPNPNFLNTPETNREYRHGKSRWFMADFYKFQRTRLNILMDNGSPVGGKWSFDAENRKKVPKKLLPNLPTINDLTPDAIDLEAKEYIERKFPNHPGNLERLIYPTSHEQSAEWLDRFLEERFDLFGVYEDAIVEGQSWLWHSVLTPMLNIGLLSPQQIVDRALEFANQHDVPLNSLEGFIRQIIGWREFMRATYEELGVPMRTTNAWNHQRKIPQSFYDGNTEIAPIDDVIERILNTGYCHHIERLMVLGGFMYVCEFDPNEIYRWFMEMFVDSYDWVMVPNAYAMSQNADGGLITTKPYFSGSSYIRKMSHYKTGPWCKTWDGLYWRWIWNHADGLAKNPRWAMMVSMAKKMDEAKITSHLQNAEAFLTQL